MGLYSTFLPNLFYHFPVTFEERKNRFFCPSLWMKNGSAERFSSVFRVTVSCWPNQVWNSLKEYGPVVSIDGREMPYQS